MKVIILDCEGKHKIIDHFIAYGLDSFIVFGASIETEYYLLNGITLTFINSFEAEETTQKLLKIKGSLDRRFVVVYSSDVCNFDIDELKSAHVEAQSMATLLQSDNRLCAVLCEEEVGDILTPDRSFEKDVLSYIGEICELQALE